MDFVNSINVRNKNKKSSLDYDNQSTHSSFPLSRLQQAYLFGSQTAFDLHVATHTYFEFQLPKLNIDSLETAWNQLIRRHEALRMVATQDGQMLVLTDTPHYSVKVMDLSNENREIKEKHLETVRAQFERTNLDFCAWPGFELQISRMSDTIDHVHINVSPMFVDGRSVSKLFHELSTLYQQLLYGESNTSAADLKIKKPFCYKEYATAREQAKSSDRYQKAKDYWWIRLESLPPGPELPLNQVTNSPRRSQLSRSRVIIPAQSWNKLKSLANQYKLGHTAVILTVYAAVIAHWSKTKHFTITMLVQNRDRQFEGAENAIASFTSTLLVEMDFRKQNSFIDQVKAVQKQLFLDLMHTQICGLELLQERNREHHTIAHAGSPVAFVSNLEVNNDPTWSNDYFHRNGKYLLRSNLETPQILLDHQIAETQDGELALNWDAMENAFYHDAAVTMLQSYQSLLLKLADTETCWHQALDISLPDTQLAILQNANQTTRDYDRSLLHELFLRQAPQCEHAIAVITSNRQISYRQLFNDCHAIAEQLQTLGVTRQQVVAIFMHKGWEQIPAALGILSSGAAYVPIDPSLPSNRIEYLLDCCDIQHVVTQPDYTTREELLGRHCITVTDSMQNSKSIPNAATQNLADLAYMIFTSGSTGTPKGVMLNHDGPVNTILDINKTFDIKKHDRVFAISALSFDLSVYDLFGLLAVGGSIVIPDYDRIGDPAHWLDMLEKHQVSVWNSAPALMQMMVEYARDTGRALPASLKVVMLSGDWIPTWLPTAIQDEISDVKVYSLGGATEASIWSIYYPVTQVDPAWKSIPYGKPLKNQTFHVLDTALRPRPIGVPGDLYIGGVGLAMGYWKNTQQTDKAFIVHPESGDRLYRTGDLGRYLSDGNIEFLGREDAQIKLQGYRVELGEIESVLQQHPSVNHAVVIVYGTSSAARRLVAYVAIGQNQINNEEIVAFASRHLPSYMVPATVILLNQLPVTSNGKIDRNNLPLPESFQKQPRTPRPPKSRTEMTLAAIWKEILNLDHASVDTQVSFFDLGGQSFLSVRLMSRIQQQFGVSLPLATLIEADTIALLASKIQAQQQNNNTDSNSPLVLLSRGEDATPLFLIHPVGGNVLCYRELAEQLKILGKSIYGLQSFGLISPHPQSNPTDRLSIEGMAASYIEAMKSVQSQGPYHVGGWSMGGVLAVEVARQLTNNGDRVEHLFLIDSPAPVENNIPDEAACVKWFVRDLLGENSRWLDTEFSQQPIKWNQVLNYIIDNHLVDDGLRAEDLDTLYKMFVTNLTALRNYQAANVIGIGKILITKANDHSIEEISAHPYCQDPAWGWRSYLDNRYMETNDPHKRGADISVQPVPGNHYSIFSSQHLPALSHTLINWYNSQ